MYTLVRVRAYKWLSLSLFLNILELCADQFERERHIRKFNEKIMRKNSALCVEKYMYIYK